MKHSSKSIPLLLVSLLLLPMQPVTAAPADAGLVGRLTINHAVEVNSLSVVLLTADGASIAEAAADPGGRYRIDHVPAGEYLVVLRDGEGRFAPVFDEPLRLAPGTVERRDIRVQPSIGDPLAADADEPLDREQELKNYSRLRIWWAGLSGGRKTLTILGFVGGAGLAYALLSDDTEVSPMTPVSSN